MTEWETITTDTMPQEREGQTTITFYLPIRQKDRFARLCSLKNTTMTDELRQFITDQIEANEQLLVFVEEQLKEKTNKESST